MNIVFIYSLLFFAITFGGECMLSVIKALSYKNKNIWRNKSEQKDN